MNFKIIITCFLLVLNIIAKSQQIVDAKVANIRPLTEFDYTKPLFHLEKEQLINAHRFLHFYAISGYREGVEPVKGFINMDATIDMEHGTVRSYWINSSIQDILTVGALKSGQVVLEVEDPSHYRYDPSLGSKLDWMRKNTYCLEFLYPFGTTDFKELRAEVARIFNVTAKRERRVVDALVLIRTSTEDKIKSDGKGESNYDMKGYFHNVPLSRLSHPLNEAEMPPLVDETDYKGNVDLDLKINSWSDINALRAALQRYDLDIKKEKREVEMFVITENQFKK